MRWAHKWWSPPPPLSCVGRLVQDTHGDAWLANLAQSYLSATKIMGGFSAMKSFMTLAIVASLTAVSSSSHAYQLAISQYGRVSATLPWAVAIALQLVGIRGVASL